MSNEPQKQSKASTPPKSAKLRFFVPNVGTIEMSDIAGVAGKVKRLQKQQEVKKDVTT